MKSVNVTASRHTSINFGLNLVCSGGHLIIEEGFGHVTTPKTQWSGRELCLDAARDGGGTEIEVEHSTAWKTRFHASSVACRTALSQLRSG